MVKPHTRQELRILLKNNRGYLEYIAFSDKAYDDRLFYFNITRRMARYILMEFERTCTRCHETKPEKMFGATKNRRSGKIGLKARCMKCEAEVSKEYYKNNKQTIKLRKATNR